MNGMRLRGLLIGLCVLAAANGVADTGLRVSDINPGPANSGPMYPMVAFSGKLYFSANGPGIGRELHSYDGVNPPALVDEIVDGTGSSEPADLEVFGSALYFTANDGSGKKIWKYDGVNPLAPIAMGGAEAPQLLKTFGSLLVFYAENSDGHSALWKFDGTNPASVAVDLGTANDGVRDDPFGVLGSHLVFAARLSGSTNLWQWDGVNPASQLPGPANSVTFFRDEFVAFNGIAIWGNSDPGGSGDTVLWRWNGVSAPQVIGNFDVEGGMGYHNGFAYFAASDLTPGNETERELWRYDGVAAPTRVAPGVELGLTSQYRSFNAALYFMHRANGAFVDHVWKYDGVGDPEMDPSEWPDEYENSENGFTPLGDFLYLSADSSDAGIELWRIIPEGGPAGPAPTVTAIAPTSGPAGGGTAVTIAGTNFVSGASATVGGVSATNVQVLTPGSVTAVTAAMVPGVLHPVTVTNTDAQTGVLGTAFLADFLDVPQADPFHDFVETLVRNGVTAGCGGGNYCRNGSITRAQMAVFLLKANLGSAYLPPPCAGTVFDDVPCQGATFDPWIEDLAARGITGGCGGGLYCPNNPITRQQMAVFLLKALEGAAYTPPACDGTVFDDVLCSGGAFDPWIEELASRDITNGCSITPPLYCPTSPNTRGQMAVFLVRTFDLQ